MWSAEEVLQQGYKTATLPDFGGQKYFTPTADPVEQRDVDRAIGEFELLVHEERVTRKQNLSVGFWDVERQEAVVEVVKRKHFLHFGTATLIDGKNGFRLLPEEALFLQDQGLLELYLHDLPLSLEEAYNLILPVLPSFEYYQVYAHLCRIGYVVNRYKRKCAVEQNTCESVDGDLQLAFGDSSEDPAEHSPNSPSKSVDSEVVTDYLEPMISGHVGHLWTGEPGERPLVRPSDATSTAAVLSKLKILKPLNLRDARTCDSTETDTETARKYEIAFDVYASKSRSKTERITKLNPDYRVIVSRFSDAPPSLKDMSRLSKESGTVHLKIGVADHGNVSFFGVFGVELPAHITQG